MSEPTREEKLEMKVERLETTVLNLADSVMRLGLRVEALEKPTPVTTKEE